MSIVYNNSRVIGKCKSYEIEKVQGSKDFIKMVDFEMFDQLNENQRIVLDWLQAYADKDSGDKPMQTIFFMWDCIRNNSIGTEVLSALRKLSRAEQFQVLAAFAEWGMSQEVPE